MKRVRSLRWDVYNPASLEQHWYVYWQKHAFFQSTHNNNNENTYSIVLPPPNVTGALHIGHALTNSIQDVLIRWRRMRGDDVSWIPGLDHAGIATQIAVEKHLMKTQNKSRHDLGREEFVELVMQWKNEYGHRIIEQMKRLGGSLDWDRLVFTMDNHHSDAVNEAFVKLYDSGLIFRGERLVSWCPYLKTVLSDIEVDYIDIEGETMYQLPSSEKVKVGVMYWIKYEIEGEDFTVKIGTTRPETILGDTAIAIHPDDERYLHLHGKCARNPITGAIVPIVLDKKLVNPELGTGVVKVTPAHDIADFTCGKHHSLPFVNIFDDNACLSVSDLDSQTFDSSQWNGLSRFQAREKVINTLKEKDLFSGESSHNMRLAICSRSGDILESLIKEQWFVKTDKLAEDSLNAAENGQLTIIGCNGHEEWRRWLSQPRDWCISRQLWWGHRIPAYKVKDHWIVARSTAEAISKAKELGLGEINEQDLLQDDDVLDTWFSSGIFPLSACGWPNQLDKFYPISLMETGSDILFFWVARMVMMCSFLNDGKLPFNKVLLHPLVRDAKGKKMSKSLGNVIDPLEVIEGRTLDQLIQRLHNSNIDKKEIKSAEKSLRKQFPDGILECGSDALRMALCSYLEQNLQVNMDINRCFKYRAFCNKMWQATKFVLARLPDDITTVSGEDIEDFDVLDQWIFYRLSNLAAEVNQDLENYDFAGAVDKLNRFFVNDFCDVYIEFCKSSQNLENNIQEKLLYTCLDTYFRLAHPFMPFVTEELWQSLTGQQDNEIEPKRSLMIESYPFVETGLAFDDHYTTIETGVNSLLAVLHGIRKLVHVFGQDKPRSSLEFFVQCGKHEISELVNYYSKCLEKIAGVGTIEVDSDGRKTVNGPSHASAGTMVTIHVDPEEAILTVEKQVSRLQKKLDILVNDHQTLKKRLSNPDYQSKVPAEIQKQHHEKLKDLDEKMHEQNLEINKMQTFVRNLPGNQ